METTVVIPNWNGERWLPDCLDSILKQSRMPVKVIVVDNGSSDDSLALIRDRYPIVEIVELDRNYGFAYAVNRGIEAAESEAVALINTDVQLSPQWLERTIARLEEAGDIAAVACKMVDLDDNARIYSAGDTLRRDGVGDQRGRFELDRGQFDSPGEVFAACAGAALYRRAALSAVGNFDERFFAYLEDIDLGVRLRLAGWRCVYEPAVAKHAGEGSSHQLKTSVKTLVERNTLIIVAKYFKLQWLPLVLYRQVAWKWHAIHDKTLASFLAGMRAGLKLLPYALCERQRLLGGAVVPIEQVIPAAQIRR